MSLCILERGGKEEICRCDTKKSAFPEDAAFTEELSKGVGGDVGQLPVTCESGHYHEFHHFFGGNSQDFICAYMTMLYVNDF